MEVVKETNFINLLGEELKAAFNSGEKTKSKISNFTGISYKTLIKLSETKANIARIEAYKVVKLVKSLFPKNYNNILNSYKDELETIDSTYRIFFDSVKPETIKSYNGIEAITENIEDRTSFLVFLMAVYENGTTLSKIKDLLGKHGETKAYELVSKEVLSFEDDVLKTNFDEYVYFAKDFLARHLSDINSLYDSVNSTVSGEKKNYIMFSGQNNNLAGIIAKQQVAKKFHEDIASIDNDPRFIGEIPTFTTMCMDTFESKFEVLQ